MKVSTALNIDTTRASGEGKKRLSAKRVRAEESDASMSVSEGEG